MKADSNLREVYSVFLEHYESCKSDPETMIMRCANATPLKSPLFISWEITSECNLSCRHCRAAFNHSRDLNQYPPLEEYKRVVRNFGENEVHRIGITGGEPFLHPYLFDILFACKQAGMDIILYTNATLINEEYADMLCAILTEDDIIHISLDGGNEAANDMQRGKGVFKKVLTSLELLKTKNINIRLNVVPTVYNQHTLLELCDLAIQFGVKEFGASPLMSSGRAAFVDIAPDYKKMFEIELDVVNRLKGTDTTYVGGISGTVHNYLSLPELFDSHIFSLQRESSTRKKCDAGNRKVFIDALGDVYPCSLFASFPSFVKGNIFETKLETIWTSETWDVFRKGIPITASICKKCPLFSLCNGGCMALGYQWNGDLGAMDPRCPACGGVKR